MEVSNAQHHQAMSSRLEDATQHQEKKLRPNPEQFLRCPRCDSTNTKFCYYNNYSLTQPRYFCKGCRRYWTQGGSLRNVPVGGGCRKNKRSSSSSASSSSASSKKTQPDQELFPPALPLPPLSYDPNDLSLAFASLQNQDNSFLSHAPNAGFLDILRSNNNGMYNGNYGYEMMIPYDAGMMSNGTTHDAVTTTTAAATASIGGDQIEQCNGNVGNVDPVLRDYWNGNVGAGSGWHGLINSSLM